jgi:hypothetical protein
MAWIVKLPPTPRHSQTRWQVRYRDGTTQRSAGISPIKTEARSVQRAVEQGDHVACSDQLSPTQGSMLFGKYVTTPDCGLLSCCWTDVRVPGVGVTADQAVRDP